MTNENSAVVPDPLPGEFPRPSWIKGSSWVVRYRVRTVNIEKSQSAEPAYMEHRWVYHVEDVTSDGRVHLTGRHLEEGSPRRVSMQVLGSTAALLDIAPGPREQVDAVSPYLPLEHNLSGDRNDVWPVFPLAGEPRTFDRGRIEQSVDVLRDRAIVTITRRWNELGTEKERIAVQTWERGRPWWSTMEVRGRILYPDKPFEEVEVEGEVEEWHVAPQSGK